MSATSHGNCDALAVDALNVLMRFQFIADAVHTLLLLSLP